MSATLVFPGGMPRAIAFTEEAVADGRDVVGASSIPHDPSRSTYQRWATLPFITDAAFDEALDHLLARENISSIFTPNPVVWSYLSKTLPLRNSGVRILKGDPVEREMAPYRAAFRFARSVSDSPLFAAGIGKERAELQTGDVAALFRHADALPGMCDHEKIRAFCEIFPSVPCGDVVEIGSWWGKSAFVLNFLAQKCSVGPLLCIDPWSDHNLIQKDELGMVDSTLVSADEAFEVFLSNLAPYAHGNLNYLRMPADTARARYQSETTVKSPTFGQTTFCGRIALLHIDGNHSYENAKSDVLLWAPKIVAGGWLVLDDYIWPYGDGPKRAGDEFLSECAGRFDCAFVMGSALFVRMAEST